MLAQSQSSSAKGGGLALIFLKKKKKKKTIIVRRRVRKENTHIVVSTVMGQGARYSAQGGRTLSQRGCTAVWRAQESFPEESIFDLT